MISAISALVATILTVVPTTPSRQGGWTTYLKPYRYSDLLVTGDTVWCATREAGLLRFDRATQHFSSITRGPNSLASNELSMLTYDGSGRLWIGTYGAGASRMSPDGTSWALINAFDGLPSDTVNCLTAEGDTMWIGTPRGIAFWNGAQIAGSLPIFGQPSPFASDNITGVVVHKDSLFVANDGGIYVSPRASGLQNWATLNNGLVSTQVQALVTNDTLMFCTANFRAYVYVNDNWQAMLGVGFVYRMYSDHGVVTISTDNGFFRLLNGGYATINPGYPSNANEKIAYAVASDGAGRYLAANFLGLFEQPSPGDMSSWPLFTPDTPPDNDMRNVNVDGIHTWTTSVGYGVGRFDGAQWQIWPNNGDFYFGPRPDTTFAWARDCWALLVDRVGKKWISCWESAVEEIDDSASPPHFVHHTFPALDVSKTRMWGSAADSLGGRWFGGDTNDLGNVAAGGLLHFDQNGNEAARYLTDDGILNDKIHALTVDKYGKLYIGYPGQGAQYTTFPLTTPLTLTTVPLTASLDVQGMVARGDTLWMLTTHSLRRYKTQPVSFVAEYTIPEATPLFAANPLSVGPDGSPWLGTEAGMRVYHPNGTSEDFTTKNSPIAGDQIYGIRVHPRTGVVWITTSTGMNSYDPGYRPPLPPPVAQLSVQIYPNPISLNHTGIQLRLRGNATVYQGAIYDLSGRRLREFEAGANGRVIWDGRDSEGHSVHPGVYFVRVEAGGRSAMVRVAVLR